MSASVKGGDGPHVIDYYAALQVGICHGPVDAVSQILIGEKYVYPMPDPYMTITTVPVVQPDGQIINVAIDWSGLPSITSNTQFLCYLPNLFGGDDHEGGCVGQIGVFLGTDDQEMPDWWAFRYGLDHTSSPGYRGQCTAFFGHAWALWPGFLWATNSPVLRETWWTVQRAPKGLNTTNRSIEPIPVRRERTADIIDPDTGDTTSQTIYDMFVAGPNANGAHIIYECVTDSDFGRGMDISEIDVDSFNEAAAVLYAEKLGLSFSWTQQSTIDEFVNEVERHIDGKLFTNPATGKLTLRLVRAITDYSGLFEINEGNSVLQNFQRKALSETTSEVIVTWTNPWNEEPETVVVQSLAAVNLSGATVPHSANYPGARDPVTATQLGARDLRTAGVPLASAEAIVNREGWSLVPTDVVRVVWPEYGLDGVYFRILRVDYGKPGESTIKVSLVEDIFSYDVSAYSYPPASLGGGDTIEAPRAMMFERAITIPAYWLIVNSLLSSLDTAQAYIAVLASQPQRQNISAILNEQVVAANGDTSWTSVGPIAVLGRSYLSAMGAKAASVVTTIGPLTGGDAPSAAWFGVIGEVEDDESEIVMVQAIETIGVTTKYYLVRGCFDTVPRSWPDHTACYWIGVPINSADPRVQIVGTAIPLKLQSRTVGGTLDISEAPTFTALVSDRPHLPNRPANVKLNGKGLAQDWVLVAAPPGSPNPYVPEEPTTPIDALPLIAGVPNYVHTTGDDLVITWSQRNRLTENGRVLNWFDGDVSPESGQTTHIRVEHLDGSMISEWTSVVGATHTIPSSTMDALGPSRLIVSSRRDGDESLQKSIFYIDGGVVESHFDSTVTFFDSTTKTMDMG